LLTYQTELNLYTIFWGFCEVPDYLLLGINAVKIIF